MLLTAAQSFFAVVTLINLSMSLKEAAALFGLFWAQFLAGAVVPEDWHGKELVLFALVYLVLGLYGPVREPPGGPAPPPRRVPGQLQRAGRRRTLHGSPD